MLNAETIESVIAIVSAIIIFLGLQALIGNLINQYPWLFIGGGAILFIFRKKIAGYK